MRRKQHLRNSEERKSHFKDISEVSLRIHTIFTLQVFGCICDLHRRARLEGLLRENEDAHVTAEAGRDRLLNVRLFI